MSETINLTKEVLVIAILCNLHFLVKHICEYSDDWSTRYIMSIIVSMVNFCDESQFQTLLCVHYTIVSVVKLDLLIRALLLDHIHALEKTTRTPHVHLVFKEINGITSQMYCFYVIM